MSFLLILTCFYVTRKITPLPNQTSPDTVKWSNSKQSGILPKRLRHSFTLIWAEMLISSEKIKNPNKYSTLAKPPPNFTNGTDGNDRKGFISSRPFFCVNKLLMIRTKSLVVFTGKNLLLGTFIPRAPLKFLIAAPDAVSNCITFTPLSSVLKRFQIALNSYLL